MTAEIRLGTPAEVAAAAAEVEGLKPEPLIRVTFYGHLVHNPDQVGTLCPAVSGHAIDIAPSIPWPAAKAMLPILLDKFLAELAKAEADR